MNNSYFKHPSPITQHPSPNTHHPTPNTQHPSPITHHPTPITHHPTPITQHILLLALALLFPLHVDASHVINIDSQERFDQMNTLLTRAIDDGETDIVVDIAQGVYFYRNNHLDRDGDQCPNVSIAIQGHDAVLIAAGRDYHDGDSLKDNVNPDAVFIDMAQLTALDFWDDCRFAEGLVEVVDEEAKLCRLPVSTLNTQHPTPNTQHPSPNTQHPSPNTQHPSPNTQHPSPNTQHLYINIPQWFASTTYKVDRAEEGYLYFTAPKLEYIERSERSGYNVNYDHIIGGQDIRFRLWRPSLLALRGNEGTLHECRTHRFMTAQQCAYRHFTLSGLHFLGSSYSIGLIRLDGIHTEGFMVEHCHFEAIKGLVLWADETPAITFSDNTVEHCSSSISTSNSCTDTRVERNTFSNCGEDLKQSFCVQCKGKDYYIGHNSFRNFGYGAVGVGEWLGNEKRYESSGVIEHNEAWYDEDYLAHKERHTLMDAGAIYLWSKNDNVDIRYNYIHDIDGMLLNRGIFCDDGACHFNIHDNVIVNIANSYSIDARNCEKKFPGANENNRVERNIVSSAIKFEGSSQGTGAGGGLSSPLPGRGNGCVVSGNVMLCRDGQEPPANIYTRLTVDSPDRRLTFYGAGADGIIVDRQQLERLRRLSAYDSAIKAAKWRYK